jgi:hypothetical protein
MYYYQRRRLWGGYSKKVLSYGPVAYWPLNEESGSVAYDISGNGRNGAYTGVTLGQDGIGDGGTCPLFDGANDYVNIIAAQNAYNGAEGALIVWAKASGAGMWSDGTLRYIIHLFAGATTFMYIQRTAANNALQFRRRVGAADKVINATGVSSTEWMSVGLSWSETGDTVKAFYNASQLGATQTGLGTWSGVPSVMTVGAYNTTPANVWDGYEGSVILFNSVQSNAAMIDLMTI